MSRSKPASHFRVLQKFNVAYASNTITQYESTRTGMRVVIVDAKGPRVNARIAFATEICDDSGAPHTLEHLLFCGSRSYPHRGFLDKLAARAYSRTNAATWNHVTEYQVKTAGSEGFAQILPVYLEHLLLPTLTDNACFTEVYHVDDTGKDSGVVYSEMQGCQNMLGELTELQANRMLYPEWSGFRSETGGLMDALRVLTADKIRSYHKDMYQPKNMRLAITGEVDHQRLLQVLDQFEETVLDMVPIMDAPFRRPWIDSKPVPLLADSKTARVEFPSDDESTGQVTVKYLGPAYDKHIGNTALHVLCLYLSNSSASVLDNTLIEKEELGSGISFDFTYNLRTVIEFVIYSIATEILEHAEKRFFEVLKDTASNPLDMDHLLDCLKVQRRRVLENTENPSKYYKATITSDHVFGRRDGTDLQQLATLNDLDSLKTWTEKQWRDHLSKWIANAKHITVLSVPSNKLSDKIKESDEARIKQRKEELGEEGLRKVAKRFNEVKTENQRPIPDSLFDKFSIPSVESVHFISTTTARAGKAKAMGKLENDIQTIVDKDDDSSPLFMHFEHFPSNFVQVSLLLCTGSVPVELKPLLSLYVQNFVSTPVMRNGKRMEFEDVVLELEKEMFLWGAEIYDLNNEVMVIRFKTETENYGKVISWLRTLLFDAIHDPERLKSSITKILADLPEWKRDADAMADAVNVMVRYKPESSVRAQTTLSRGIYLRKMKRLLQSNPRDVVKRFAELCRILHRPENFRVFIAGDITKIENPVSSWNPLLAGMDTTKDLEPLDSRIGLLNEVGRKPGSSAYIVPMAGVDTSFALVTAKAPDYFGHPDTPSLYVAVTLMNSVEGPLWVAVRGPGMAYSVWFIRRSDTASLTLSIHKSTDSYKAFAACKEAVENIASGRTPITQSALEGAVCEIVLKMADEEPTYSQAAVSSFANQVIRGVPKDNTQQLLLKAQKVTPEEVRVAVAKYMVPVFNPDSSNLVVTCAPTMKEGLRERFAKYGYTPEVKSLEDFEDGYGEELGEDEEDDEDDDESEEDEDGNDDEQTSSPEQSPVSKRRKLVVGGS